MFVDQVRPTAHLRKYAPYVIFTVCLSIYLYPFSRLFLGGDQGTVVYGAVRVMDGQVPLRDFFEAIGPGSFYWLALFFKVFGTRFLAIRISILLTSLSISGLMYYLSRRLGSEYASIPAVLFLATSFGPAWPANTHHQDSNLLALLAFTSVLGWVGKQRPWMLWVAGILAGLTTMCLQPKGICLFVSFLLIVFFFRRTPGVASLCWLAGGYLAVLVAVGLLYWRINGLEDLVRVGILSPLTHYSRINAVPYGYEIGKRYWKGWATALGMVAPRAVAFCAAGFLVVPLLFVAALPAIAASFITLRRNDRFNSVVLTYWISGAALWVSEIHRKDITHLVHGSPLLLIPCFYHLAQERNKVVTCILQLVCISSFALAASNWLMVLARQTTITTRRGDFYAIQSDPVVGFLEAHVKPGEEIFAYPYCPQYYFLSATKNPTRFSLLMYNYNTASDFDEAVTSLEKHNIRYVIWQREFERLAKVGFPAYHLPPKNQLIMEPYLAERYRLIECVGGFDILERRTEYSTSNARQQSEPHIANWAQPDQSLERLKP